MESIWEKLVWLFESIKRFMDKQCRVNQELVEKITDLECKINVLKEALYRLQIKEDVRSRN